MYGSSLARRSVGALVLAVALSLLVAGPAGARAQKITLKDGIGRTVAIQKQATRIVALEWSLAEDVLALKPSALAGVADIKGYRTWLKTPPIRDGVTDVGTRA